MNTPPRKPPSLTPSVPLAFKETGRVMPIAPPPETHRGWYSRGYLPHRDHPWTIQSLNFRLADSLPRSVLERWRNELGLASSYLRRRIEEYLDAGHGECWLRRSDIAELVENALMRFDRERYRLLAWCVMPNHVHALIEMDETHPLAEILHSWKSFTSKQANKLLGREGEFWQREYLDRYVRHAEHYAAVVAYIEDNPVKAGLAKIRTDWPWSSARWRASGSAGILPASG